MILQNQTKMRKCVLAVITTLLLLSAGYLIYMGLAKDIQYGLKFRFFIFALEHFYTIFMIFYNSNSDEQNPLEYLNWIVIFTVGNFALFGGAQIYLATQPETSIDFSQKFLAQKDFGVLSYIHFYYQINIYFGVFSLFSVVMCIMFKIHQRNERQRMEAALDYLDEHCTEAQGNEEPCSICLAEYEKGEICYKLHCKHMFHKDCLQDWMRQKISCPLCRDVINS